MLFQSYQKTAICLSADYSHERMPDLAFKLLKICPQIKSLPYLNKYKGLQHVSKQASVCHWAICFMSKTSETQVILCLETQKQHFMLL